MDVAERRTDVKPTVNSAALVDGLLRVSQIVRLRFNDWLGGFELNDGRHSVLAALAKAEQGGCSQADLAERLGQSESNISTLIERMQRDGLVNRLRSEADRRKRVLLITDAGRSTLESVDASRTAWAGKLLNGISVDDRPRLFGLLQQLASSLESSDSTDAPGISVFVTRNDSRNEDRSPTVAPPVSVDPTDDPQSPQFALRKMLLALSAHAGEESNEKEAA